MNATSARTLLALALALAALPAAAQRPDWRDDPKLVEAARRHSDDVGHALGMVGEARKAMREGHPQIAEALAETAADDLLRLGGAEYPLEARELLAELALRRGDPREALRQADLCEPRFMVQRFGMTRALALVGLGRTTEARAMVLAEVGTPEKPGFFRQSEHVWRFPIDADPSDRALKATTIMVRGLWRPGIPEGAEDLRAALVLAPSDPILHLLEGHRLSRAGQYDAAATEYARAEALGGKDERLASALKTARQGMRGLIADAKAKAGGTAPPASSTPPKG